MNARTYKSKGFTLLELLASLAIFLVISGSILGGMAAYQKTYRQTQITMSLNQQMRSALELMSTEIGQAGLPVSRVSGSNVASNDNALIVQAPLGTLGGATANATPIPVTTTAPTFPFYANQWITIDTNGTRELVRLTAADATAKTITAASFATNHGSPDPIFSGGLYPEGILWFSDGTYTATATANTYTGYELWLFGDITNKGSLDLISYKCDATTKQLVRTVFDTSSSPTCTSGKPSKTGSTQDIVLLQNVTNCDPAVGVPPFTLVKPTAVPATTPTFTFVTSISVTLQLSSLTNDPQTHKPITLSKSYLNIQPRNILAGFNTNPTDLSTNYNDEFQENPQYGAFKCFPAY